MPNQRAPYPRPLASSVHPPTLLSNFLPNTEKNYPVNNRLMPYTRRSKIRFDLAPGLAGSSLARRCSATMPNAIANPEIRSALNRPVLRSGKFTHHTYRFIIKELVNVMHGFFGSLFFLGGLDAQSLPL